METLQLRFWLFSAQPFVSILSILLFADRGMISGNKWFNQFKRFDF
jgi:hypothetical protein